MSEVKLLWEEAIQRHTDSFMEGDLDEDNFTVEMFRLNVPECIINETISNRRHEILKKEEDEIMDRGMR